MTGLNWKTFYMSKCWSGGSVETVSVVFCISNNVFASQCSFVTVVWKQNKKLTKKYHE
jgi:hypothetical protein